MARSPKDQDKGKAGGSELRQWGRVPVGQEVEVAFDDFRSFSMEYAENISTGGMYLRTANIAPSNTVVRFKLFIRDIRREISGKAVVVWTKEVSHAFGAPQSGMGLRFLELDGDSEAFILEFLSRQSSTR